MFSPSPRTVTSTTYSICTRVFHLKPLDYRDFLLVANGGIQKQFCLPILWRMPSFGIQNAEPTSCSPMLKCCSRKNYRGRVAKVEALMPLKRETASALEDLLINSMIANRDTSGYDDENRCFPRGQRTCSQGIVESKGIDSRVDIRSVQDILGCHLKSKVKTPPMLHCSQKLR